MALFVDQKRLGELLREYQFRAYDRPMPKRGMTPLCQNQIKAELVKRENYLKEKTLPLENRPRKGFKKEQKTDETLDDLIDAIDKYVVFKKTCLENHLKCFSDAEHRLKTDNELLEIEKELGVIVTKMAAEVFRAWFAGYTNYYKNELISLGMSAFWEKLTFFNVYRKSPFSYYTSVISTAMKTFIKEYHVEKENSMSLSIFEDVNSA